MWQFLAREQQSAFSRIQLGNLELERQVGRLLRVGRSSGPSGRSATSSSRSSSMPSTVFALTG